MMNLVAQPSEQIPDQTIFFWIDILGFSDKLENPDGYHMLKNNLESFRRSFGGSSLFKSMIISDGLLIQLEDPKQLEASIRDLAQKQMKFVLENKVFLRGGFAVGLIPPNDDIKNNLILTDGLSRAVKLESKNVSWPIIATDEGNLKKLENY